MYPGNAFSGVCRSEMRIYVLQCLPVLTVVAPVYQLITGKTIYMYTLHDRQYPAQKETN